MRNAQNNVNAQHVMFFGSQTSREACPSGSHAALPEWAIIEMTLQIYNHFLRKQRFARKNE